MMRQLVAVECDRCLYNMPPLQFETAALALAAEAGWFIELTAESERHLCPTCAQVVAPTDFPA